MKTYTDFYAEVEKRAEAATKGPWLNAYPNACKLTPMPDHVWSARKDLVAKDVTPEDARFIAHSRTDIPALVARCRALEEALEYYADDGRWFQVTNAMGVRCYAIEERTGGDRARAVLSATPEENHE